MQLLNILFPMDIWVFRPLQQPTISQDVKDVIGRKLMCMALKAGAAACVYLGCSLGWSRVWRLLVPSAVLIDGAGAGVVVVVIVQVVMSEAISLASLYVVYVVATFYIAKGDEPVHVDTRLHEVPPEERRGEQDWGAEEVAGEGGKLGEWGHGVVAAETAYKEYMSKTGRGGWNGMKESQAEGREGSSWYGLGQAGTGRVWERGRGTRT